MKREISIFLVVGTLTVLIDLALYRGLLALGTPLSVAKAAGFIIGTVFAYLANRFWTFGNRGAQSNEIERFILVYGISLIVNVGINTAALALLPAEPEFIHLAFLLATGASACTNFAGMKLFVFASGDRETV